MIRTRLLARIGAGLLAPALAALLSAGCEVKNPGAILDEDLNDETTMLSLVVGMSSDFSTIVDDLSWDQAIASGELTGSGSYFETGLLRTGVVNREDQNFEWGGMHRARWVAEDGILRMREVFGPEGLGNYDGHPLVARAYLFAALGHRWSGENLCYGVLDSSAVMDRSIHFDSALVRADSGIWHASRAGVDTLATTLHGVKAQAYVGLGNWTQAVAEAALVPTDFVYVAFFDDNSSREENVMVDETHGRAEMSVWNSVAGQFAEPGDPRALYIDCTVVPMPAACNSQQGADGETDHWMQMKYPDLGADIPVVKGTEMRLIEAEAFLRNNDLANAVLRINEARDEYGLADIAPAPADIDEGWLLLDQERHLTLWMEGRRWHDMFRWDHEGRTSMPAVSYLYGGDFYLYPTGSITPKFAKDPALTKRAYCIPLSLDECQTNPNVMGTQYCEGEYVAP